MLLTAHTAEQTIVQTETRCQSLRPDASAGGFVSTGCSALQCIASSLR
uniref:Uncharacterized protein n=1 Tax=Anguilla anguilla TaxID=7936 RepID=A0A0E9R4F2_ANGAN